MQVRPQESTAHRGRHVAKRSWPDEYLLLPFAGAYIRSRHTSRQASDVILKHHILLFQFIVIHFDDFDLLHQRSEARL